MALEVNSKTSMIRAIFFWLIFPEEAFIGLAIKLELEDEYRIEAQITRSDGDALAAFASRKSEIDTMLTRLQALSDEHFGYAPDAVTWSHVGTLEHYDELLKRITNMAFNESEHPA